MSVVTELPNKIRKSPRSRRRQNVYKHVKTSLETRREFLRRLAVGQKRRRGKPRPK